MGRMPQESRQPASTSASWIGLVLVLAAAATGLVLMRDEIVASSATYDEAVYLRVATRWWRTGQQSQITRMGSPLTFWKLQQAPVLWLLDRTGRGELIDQPMERQAELLPLVRAGALWIWLVALGLCALWSWLLYGPRAMALAAWLFVLSPNLLAHGSLVTMELPLLACTTGMLLLFWTFLATGRHAWFWGSATLGGLAFSCKYTAVLFPPILAVVWWWHERGKQESAGSIRQAWHISIRMIVYISVMVLANLVVTGFAGIPLSGATGRHPTIETHFGSRLAPWIARIYETPIPQDWVGLANQMHHQASGGPSYLLGERRLTGWRHYYFVALAVKVPLTFWLLLAGRFALMKREGKKRHSSPNTTPICPEGARPSSPGQRPGSHGTAMEEALKGRNQGWAGDRGCVAPSGLGLGRFTDSRGRAPDWHVWAPSGQNSASHTPECSDDGREVSNYLPRCDHMLPITIGLFLAITALASTRNYGIRYLLPLFPLAIVWVSRVAERVTFRGWLPAGWPGWLVVVALAGQALAVASVHPYELTYFSALAGGRMGGRHVLADSNLDWGQGLKALAKLQHEQPEFRDLTLLYFGDTEPRYYGVEGTAHVVDAVDSCSELPDLQMLTTRYVAVSASLQWGPWGPPGFFAELNPIAPVRMTDDTTIAIYRPEEFPWHGSNPSRLSKDRVPVRGDLPDRRPVRRPSE